MLFRLNFNYKFYCDGNSGPNCDLKCDPTNGSFQRCTSTTNKANYSCSVLSDGQVTNCTECLEFSANFTCTKPATCSPLPIVTESSGKVENTCWRRSVKIIANHFRKISEQQRSFWEFFWVWRLLCYSCY